MKRLLIAILLTLPLLAAPAQAQTTEEQHLEFMGIPIDGTLNAFARKLQAKGMKIIDRENGTISLSGNFAGDNDCSIFLLGTSKNEIWRAAVASSTHYSWSSLADRYFTLKNMLAQKYGDPISVEEFQVLYTPNSDSDKWHCVIMDQCNYAATYITENGQIDLSIINYGILAGGAAVMLKYTDQANSQNKLDSIMDDL